MAVQYGTGCAEALASRGTTLRCSRTLTPEEYSELRRRAIFECCKWDVQLGDSPTLAPYALLIEPSEWRFLARLAERLTDEILALEVELIDRADLHGMLGLGTKLRRALRPPTTSASRHLRVMRFDFHPTGEGWRLSEVNTDVPGGFVEGAGVTKIWAELMVGTDAPGDPAQALCDALERRCTAGRIALVHATGYSDDRQVMTFLMSRLAQRRFACSLVAPDKIMWKDDLAIDSLSAHVFDAIVRFYPAEWLPNLGNCGWRRFFASSRTVLCNPAMALLSQCKRNPLVWSWMSSTKNMLLCKYIPETMDPRTMLALGAPADDWVLKPAFGRVGEDIAMPGVTSPARFQLLHRRAAHRPAAWVAQRRFNALSITSSDGPLFPCIGIFTVDGRTAGCYARVSRIALIDACAQDTALLLVGEPSSSPS